MNQKTRIEIKKLLRDTVGWDIILIRKYFEGIRAYALRYPRFDRGAMILRMLQLWEEGERKGWLDNSFSWDMTAEGHDFWSAKCRGH